MKQLVGIVTSTQMTNTARVKVSRKWTHPMYKKIVTRTKNYATDLAGVEVKVGDKVMIQETRPMSKTKRFKVVEVLK
jgi:small subunit ribosomal protein S17